MRYTHLPNNVNQIEVRCNRLTTACIAARKKLNTERRERGIDNITQRTINRAYDAYQDMVDGYRDPSLNMMLLTKVDATRYQRALDTLSIAMVKAEM